MCNLKMRKQTIVQLTHILLIMESNKEGIKYFSLAIEVGKVNVAVIEIKYMW